LAFEATMIAHLTRGAGQAAQGLGTGCKPSTKAVPLEFNDRPVKTQRDYNLLPQDGKDFVLSTLRKMNAEFGYYGAPPVPDEQLLDYFFAVAPRGEWVRIQVGKAVPGQVNLVDTGIPFWDRAVGPKQSQFRQLCDQGVGQLPGRQAREPEWPPER
jgi:hypothetical protein